MFTRFTFVIILVFLLGVVTTATVLAVSPLSFNFLEMVKVHRQNEPTPATTAGSGLADLVIVSVTIQLSGGGSCNYTSTQLITNVTISNIGAVAVAGPFVVALNGLDQTVSDGLAAGASMGLTFSNSSYISSLMVDATTVVTESDETNNIWTQWVPIPTLPPPCTPTPTFTPTFTSTPTPSITPTSTPTPYWGCSAVQAAGIASPHCTVTATFTPTFTPTPTPTIYFCPTLTPVPLWVEPVTSPTTLLTQTINVSSAGYGRVAITAESGTFGATGPMIPITLLPNTIHHLTVNLTVPPLPGCPQTGYTLSTTYDRFGNPLIIEQRTGNSEQLSLSSTSGGWVGGVKFADEDILLHDGDTNVWTLLFDGSDVGLASVDLNGFHWLPDGALLFTVDNPVTLARVGLVDDSDIVRFQPTRLGNTTAGSFTFYFDGSDVELTTADEDIDAFTLMADNALLISTLGTAKVGHYTVQDEDLLRFAPTNLGATTSGSWSLYLDGSDLELTQAKEDIGGVMIDQTGNLYFSVAGAFALPGVSGTGADIIRCSGLVTGENTSCTLSLFWHGAAYGFGNEILDGIATGAVPPLYQTTATDADARAAGEEDLAAADDAGLNEDEPSAEERDDALEHHLFIPLVVQQ